MSRPRGLPRTGGRPSQGRASDGARRVTVRLTREEYATLAAAAEAAGVTVAEVIRERLSLHK